MVCVCCRAAEKETQRQLREAEESLKGLQDKVSYLLPTWHWSLHSKQRLICGSSCTIHRVTASSQSMGVAVRTLREPSMRTSTSSGD